MISGKKDNNETKPSLTAVGMAGAFVRGLQYGYGHLFDDEKELLLAKHLFEKGLSSLSGATSFIFNSLLKTPYAAQRLFFNKTCIRSYDELTVLRKLMIKQKISEAIEKNVEQIVFLGGGYDIRPYMTATTYPKLQVFEIDRSPTRNFKIEGLRTIPENIGLDKIQEIKLENETICINNNYFLIDFDLNDNELLKTLQKYGYSQDKKTLFIAEGLTAYLTKEKNQILLKELSELMGINDEILISYMTSVIEYNTVKQAVKETNELHAFSLPKNQTIQFAKKCDLSVTQKFDASEHLELIGNKTDQVYFAENEKQSRECYYVFKKNDEMQDEKITIEDISSYKLLVPENQHKNNDSYCHIF